MYHSKKLVALINKAFSVFPKITKDIFIYGIGGSLAQIIGLITVPIITRLLSSAEYGSVDVVNATTGYFAALISLNISAGLMRHFFEIPESEIGEKQKLVSSLIWFTILFGGGIVILGVVFSSRLSNILFSNAEYSVAISLAFASLPLISLKNIFSNILRMKRKPVTYLVLNILYAIINFILIIVFVVPLGLHITGVFIAQLVTSVIIALVGAWECREYLRAVFSQQWFYKMAAYGIPMMPGSIFHWGMLTVNRILLTQYTTIDQIAYYSVATKAAKVIELAISSFTMAWQPIYLANINSTSFHGKLNKALRYYVFASLLISALVAIYAKEFFRILAPAEYQAGTALVALLCLRQLIPGAAYILGVGIVKEKKTFLISIALGAGVLTTIGVSLILMPEYGIYGAAIADLTGEIVNLILYTIFSERIYKIEWDFVPSILAVSGFLVIWLGSILIDLPNKFWDFLFRTFLLITYVLFVLFIVDRGEIVRNISANIKTHLQ